MIHTFKSQLLFAVTIGLIACTSKPAEEKAPAAEATTTSVELTLTQAQMTNGKIATSDVIIGPVNNTITLNGVIDVPPQNMVSITCPMGGHISSINLLPGQEVNKGQVLVTLQDPAYVQLQQDYLASKSRLQFLEKEYERQKELALTEATSQKMYQQVTAEYQQERTMLMGIGQKLLLLGIDAEKLTVQSISRTISIRSPIHGFISQVPVNRGRYVAPTDVLAELVDPSDIHASLTVFEKDIQFIKAGQLVKVKLVSDDKKSFPADVLLVTRSLDQQRAGLVHCHFDKYDRALVPGMAVTAEIELGRQQMPSVPESAVLLNKGKHFVLLQIGERQFRLTEIQPGAKENGMVALVNNNIDWKGKKVVATGAFTLLGMLLNENSEE